MSGTILATSGGFHPTGRGPSVWRPGPLVEYALALRPGRRRRVCYVGTATGDDVTRVQAFYSAFAGRADVLATHLALFPMPSVDDVAGHLAGQDLVWVGGGSVANLLAVWRLHGLDDALRAAWSAGTVLAGVSAGSICWHVGGTTDSFGPDLRPVTDGLGLLPHSNGVHHDSEERRRPLFRRLIGEGTLPDGYATDDGVGLHYEGGELVRVVSERPGPGAYQVRRDPAGGVTETRIDPEVLGR